MSNKVILIVGDGMRPDFLFPCGSACDGGQSEARGAERDGGADSGHDSAHERRVTEFLRDCVYTDKAQVVVPPVTLPCHMTLFHSVDPGRHGITTNIWTPQVRPVTGLCETLHAAGKKCGFFYNWEELRDLTRPGHLNKAFFTAGGTHEQMSYDITNAVVAELQADSLDFLFVHYDFPDILGHRYGFTSAEYMGAGKLFWDNIMLCKEYLPGNYGMIITSDHGGHGRSHGDDIPEDMTIPAVFYGDIFRNIKLDDGVNIADFAPTITEVMGVTADPEWEGRSLCAK